MWSKLYSVDEKEMEESWAEFFLNTAVVRKFLAQTNPEELSKVLQAGATWMGTKWTTTKAAVRMRSLTGLTLLTTQVEDYQKPFLASLALATEAPAQLEDLDDLQGELAFRLKEVWCAETKTAAQKETPPPADHAAAEEEEPDEAEEVRFAWEPEAVHLPADLTVILNRVLAGEKLEVRQLLELVPTFKELKVRAEENNHRSDGKIPQDKNWKSL
jgi:hypothetical protein